MQAVHDDVDAGARAVVARVSRGADGAVARDHRHALRRARAEKNNFHVRTTTDDTDGTDGKRGNMTRRKEAAMGEKAAKVD